MKKKRPVFQDVADCIDATRMMVSHLLRNSEQISVALHGKTATVLDELGYIPNRVSSILSNATSRAIGILLPSLTNQVFAEVLRGIESVTDAHGCQTMLAHYGYESEVEQKRLESVLPWNIDGLIPTECTHMLRTLKMIEVVGIPAVELMDSKSPCLDIAAGSDNFEAACQMIITVITHGYRRVTCLGARFGEHTIIKQRGCEQTVLDAGPVPYSVMVEQSSSYPSGIELIRQARRKYPQLGGVFCTNDDLAVGAAFECQRLGLKVPGDTTIAGFHSHDIGQVMESRPASVLTPRKRMSSIGAKRLLARIRGESMTPKMLDLDFTLSPGGSI